MEVAYHVMRSWPPLSWLALLSRRSGLISVLHGSDVEVGPDGFCEAVWPGPFSDLQIDQTDLIAGTGMRLRPCGAIFVASASTVDKLQSIDLGELVLVSNSMPCLLAAAGAELNPSANDYFDIFVSIKWGLDECKRTLAASKGNVLLTYFHNLHWNGASLTDLNKPLSPVPLNIFADYAGFLDETLARTRANMMDPARSFPYSFIGTQSTGYDSTLITSLARRHGLDKVICFESADDAGAERGSAIAERLGVRPIIIPLEAWRGIPFAEIPFIAGNCFGEEVHFCAAAECLNRKVLLTGYHGDKLWDYEIEKPGDKIRRSDPGGGALTEFRLWASFIHCPLPFWLVRRHNDIARISRSSEMAPWSLSGSYNRPVPRRIGEEAGLPREMFGARKRAASRWIHDQVRFTTLEGAKSYCQWLRMHRNHWRARDASPPVVSLVADRLAARCINALRRSAGRLARLPVLWRFKPLVRLARWGSIYYTGLKPQVLWMRRYVYPWAVAEAQKRYRTPDMRAVLERANVRNGQNSRT